MALIRRVMMSDRLVFYAPLGLFLTVIITVLFVRIWRDRACRHNEQLMRALQFLMTGGWWLVPLKCAQVGSFRSLGVHGVWNVSDRGKFWRAALFPTIVAICLAFFVHLRYVSAISLAHFHAQILDATLLSQFHSFAVVVHLLISSLRLLRFAHDKERAMCPIRILGHQGHIDPFLIFLLTASGHCPFSLPIRSGNHGIDPFRMH